MATTQICQQIYLTRVMIMMTKMVQAMSDTLSLDRYRLSGVLQPSSETGAVVILIGWGLVWPGWDTDPDVVSAARGQALTTRLHCWWIGLETRYPRSLLRLLDGRQNIWECHKAYIPMLTNTQRGSSQWRWGWWWFDRRSKSHLNGKCQKEGIKQRGIGSSSEGNGAG